MSYLDAVNRSPKRRAFLRRMGVKSASIRTVTNEFQSRWIIRKLVERFGRASLKEKTVVEVGAGSGAFAFYFAKHVRRIYAVEADPLGTRAFASRSDIYTKPSNLTWVFDTADNLVDLLRGRVDLAVVITGSDEARLRHLAERLAPAVSMPWQDYNGGRAVVGLTEKSASRVGNVIDTHFTAEHFTSRDLTAPTVDVLDHWRVE